MSDVAVLGCGPAGLLAAHAAEQCGHKVRVISKKRKSVIGGAQYLNEAIPGLTDPTEPDSLVRFIKWGTPEVYAKKVYGSEEAHTSWTNYDQEFYPAWNLQAVYDMLWGRYERDIFNFDIDTETMMDAIENYDVIFNSVPARAVCIEPEEHRFDCREVWIESDIGNGPRNMTIIYNGLPGDLWYRGSTVFGHSFLEFAHERNGNVLRVQKPLKTNCSCWIHETVRIGRYGEWRKGVLVTDAYHAAMDHLDALH